jgi:UDP-glucose 4-epimerase
MGRVVLVTGVSGDLGARFARRVCEDPAVEHVVGVDVTPPRADLPGVAFVRADIRNPVIAKVVAANAVDTVVHLSVGSGSGGGSPAAGRSTAKEHNVIGTMQLLAACQRAPGVERLVVRSSAAVYGSSSRDPAMFTEDIGAKRPPRSGYARDVLEVEGYVRGFARRRPDVTVTMLRAADVVGPHVSSPIVDYLRLPVVPTVLGYDARLQLLHVDDLVDVLHHASRAGVHGTFNVAGDGVLLLSQALRRLGRPYLPVPAPLLGAVAAASRRAAARVLDELADLLTFGRGMDTSRMRGVLGFEPAYTTPAAFADFASAAGPGPLSRTRPAAAVMGGARA